MEAREEAAEAAMILLSLGSRALRRPPEWAPRPPVETEAAAVPVSATKGWLQRRRRSPRQGWPLAKSKAWVVPWCVPDGVAPPPPLEPAHSGAGSSGEDVGLSRRRVRGEPEVKAGLYFGAAAGSVPTASGVDGARPRSQKAAAAATTPAALKEDMKASSPETPLHFAAAAAGSGASSSGDDGARSPEKRKAPRAGGSGAASSGDECCSSPSKRMRTAAAYGVREAPAAAVQVKELEVQPEQHQNRDQDGVLLFDLNEAIPLEWEQDLWEFC